MFRGGVGIGGVNVSVCQPLATTAASVTSNLATFTMSSNPQTAGFVVGMQIQVAGFTGGDTYFNAGTFANNTITGGLIILSTTSTQIIATLSHANGSASSNGTILQLGNSTTSCGGLSAIYSDPALSVPLSNPVVSDGYGNFGFWANAGLYFTQYYGATVQTTLKEVSLSCVPTSGGSCSGVFSGSIANTQVAYGTATNTLGGDSGFTYNVSAHSLFTSGGYSTNGNVSLTNPTAATSLNNYSAPTFTFNSNFWNGSASALDSWIFTQTFNPTGGANPASILTLSNTSSSITRFGITAGILSLSGPAGTAFCMYGAVSGEVCMSPANSGGGANTIQLWTANPSGNQCAVGAAGNPIGMLWETCPIMFPSTLIDLTSQSAAIGATVIINSTNAGGAGEFQVVWSAKVTTAAGVSSTLGPLTITYTDPDGVAQSITAGALSTSGSVETTDTGNTTTTLLSGIPLAINAKIATNISYAFGYASSAANAMNYSLHIRLIRVQN